MKIIDVEFFKDGGSVRIKTDEGYFFKDYGIFSKTNGHWFEGTSRGGRIITCLDKIKQLEKLYKTLYPKSF